MKKCEIKIFTLMFLNAQKKNYLKHIKTGIMKKNFTTLFLAVTLLSVFLVSCSSFDSQRGHQDRIDRHHQINQVPTFH